MEKSFDKEMSFPKFKYFLYTQQESEIKKVAPSILARKQLSRDELNSLFQNFAHNLSHDNKFCSKRNFVTSEEYINNKKNLYTILKKIPEISFLEVDFENKVEFLTTYNNMNIKVEHDYRYD